MEDWKLLTDEQKYHNRCTYDYKKLKRQSQTNGFGFPKFEKYKKRKSYYDTLHRNKKKKWVKKSIEKYGGVICFDDNGLHRIYYDKNGKEVREYRNDV